MDSVTEGTKESSVSLKGAFSVDAEAVRVHVDEVVRGTVQETLNALLDAEADRACGAGRYERSDDRQDTRAGSYQRKLGTKAGEVTLTAPRLRKLPLESAIIERYRRRESSVEEALAEMYLAGVSVRRVEDITEALWGTRVSPSTVSELNQKIYQQIEAWLTRQQTSHFLATIKEHFAQEYPLFLTAFRTGMRLGRSWGWRGRISTLPASG